MTNNHFYISALLSKLQPTQTDRARIIAYLEAMQSSGEQQQVFFTYCREWKLAPWLYTQINRQQLTTYFQAPVLEQFRQAHDTVLQQNERRNKEALRFLTEFKNAGIDVLVLKGNVFAHTIYKDAGYKRMNDFDILIRQEDWEKVRAIYTGLDYIPLGFGWSGEKHKPTRFSHTAIPFISSDFSCIAGTQWGLKSPTTHYRVDTERAWQTAVDFNFMGLPLQQLSPEFTLLHLVLHLGVYKCGTRDCMDIYNLLLHENIDEDAFVKLVQETGAVDKAYFALQLTQACSGAVSPSLLEKLQPPKKTFVIKRLNARMKMIAETGDLHHSYNDYFQDVEKSVLYFNIVQLFHQKVFFYGRIMRQIFFPPMQVALIFIDKGGRPATAGSKIRARLAAPYFVFSILAQEIGRTFTFLLFWKLLLDLFKSLVNYIIPRDSYFTYLKKRGVDPRRIQESVKNVQ